MTAVVTGGCGFIGSHLVDLLVQEGEDVVVIDDLRSGDNLPPPEVRLWKMSIGHASLLKTDIIYHLAGPVGPVGVLSQAGHIVEQVIRDANKLRFHALSWEVPLIYVSTSEIYGDNGYHRIPEYAPRVIQAGHSARMEYAVAKLAAETMLLNTPGLDVRIVRPFNVAGPRQKSAGGFVLPRFIEQAKQNRPLTVYGNGKQRRAFTHVADIVEGIYAVAQRAEPGTVWNLGNPRNECTIMELAHEVNELLDNDAGIDLVDPKTLWGDAFEEAPDKVPDIEKAWTQLNWFPHRDREAVIVDAAA